MKNLTLILLIPFLFILPLYLSSCEEDHIPPITAEGRGIFGCKVNGKLWLPNGRFGQSPTWIDMSIDRITVQAQNFDNYTLFTMAIWDLDSLKVSKTYDLRNKKFYIEYVDFSEDQACHYNKITSGELHILKYDPSERIIAGTFEFHAENDNCEPIEVSEGRFDISEIIRF